MLILRIFMTNSLNRPRELARKAIAEALSADPMASPSVRHVATHTRENTSPLTMTMPGSEQFS